MHDDERSCCGDGSLDERVCRWSPRIAERSSELQHADGPELDVFTESGTRWESFKRRPPVYGELAGQPVYVEQPSSRLRSGEWCLVAIEGWALSWVAR